MSHITKLIAAQAAEYGFYLVDAIMPANYSGPPKRAWRIICDGCKAKFETTSWGPKTGPSMMVKQIHKQGWDVAWRKPPRCPKCSHPREEKKVMQDDNRPPVVHSSKIATLPMSPMSTMINPKIMRDVFSLLEDRFDEKARLYRDGFTDERVAKECGTGAEVVAKLRREAFGELAEDPRISNLRDDVRLLQMEFADLGKKMEALAARLNVTLAQVAR